MFGTLQNYPYICGENTNRKNMSYNEIAQMELMNAVNSINSELELKEFRDMLAQYFARKSPESY